MKYSEQVRIAECFAAGFRRYSKLSPSKKGVIREAVDAVIDSDTPGVNAAAIGVIRDILFSVKETTAKPDFIDRG